MSRLNQQINDQAAQDKQLFMDFLEQDYTYGAYTDKLHQMIDRGENRLIVNMNDLRAFRPELAKRLLNSPAELLPPFEKALKDSIAVLNRDYLKEHVDFSVGLEGAFGTHHVTPRGLSASFIGKVVCVEGIVTKCSLIRPKIVRSVHYCETTKKSITREYRDATSFDGPPTGSTYPREDEAGNPLETEYGLCVYTDHQSIGVQEMPESAPAGQLPRSVDVFLDDDLVDKVKPGDRVQVIGAYRVLASKHAGDTSAIFRTVVIGNNVRLLSKEVVQPTITDQDIRSIKQLAKTQGSQMFDLLAHSLAPSIYGHEYVKKGLLCLLLGGLEKNLNNGGHIRGDINMLLVGDPSTAKSQILRFVLHVAPLAIATTGRGSSGVGLTAAVTADSETGERRLEAGAMVLADRGIVCIDEFDKMSDVDRVAIHEVMEQQTVTIAKAGIHTSLNARCSVLAAANPIYGQYDPAKSPQENVALPDSLLSRFDLLFIILDTMNPVHDRKIADHVLRMHRYRRPGEADGQALSLSADSTSFLYFVEPEDQASGAAAGAATAAGAGSDESVFEKHDALLRGNSTRKVLTISFLKKYLQYAKTRFRPVLTQEAAEYISQEYGNIRSEEVNGDRTFPITARTLEAMIRLATAHAKARLSQEVTAEDAKEAYHILRFALLNAGNDEETQAKELRRLHRDLRRDSDSDGDDGDDGDDKDDNDGPSLYKGMDVESDMDDETYVPGRDSAAGGSRTPSKGTGSAATRSASAKSPAKSPAAKRKAEAEAEDDGDENDEEVQATPKRAGRARSPASSPASSSRKKPRKDADGDDEDEEDDYFDDEEDAVESTPKRAEKRGASPSTSPRKRRAVSASADSSRLNEFMQLLDRVLRGNVGKIDAVVKEVARLSNGSFSEDDIHSYLEHMAESKKIFLTDTDVYRV